MPGAWMSPGVGSSGKDELRQDSGGFRGDSALAGTRSLGLPPRHEPELSPDAGLFSSGSAPCPSSEETETLLNSAARAARQTAENASVADHMSTREAERAFLLKQDFTLPSRNTALSSASQQTIDPSAIPTLASPIPTKFVAAMSGSAPLSQQDCCDPGQLPDPPRSLPRSGHH